MFFLLINTLKSDFSLIFNTHQTFELLLAAVHWKRKSDLELKSKFYSLKKEKPNTPENDDNNPLTPWGAG